MTLWFSHRPLKACGRKYVQHYSPVEMAQSLLRMMAELANPWKRSNRVRLFFKSILSPPMVHHHTGQLPVGESSALAGVREVALELLEDH